MLSVFLVLVGVVAATRLVELGISRRHRRELDRLGARSIPEPAFAVMVSLHVAVLVGSAFEALVAGRSVPVVLGAFAIAGVLGANVLRVAAIRSLGRHWNVRVVDSTALGVVDTGPYRFVRHPNYVAVFAELLFLPLVQGAWITAALGTVAHVLVLRRRIALEEAVLFSNPRYAAVMGAKPRFFPRLGPERSRVVRAERA
jgi:methyltransferase